MKYGLEIGIYLLGNNYLFMPNKNRSLLMLKQSSLST